MVVNVQAYLGFDVHHGYTWVPVFLYMCYTPSITYTWLNTFGAVLLWYSQQLAQGHHAVEIWLQPASYSYVCDREASCQLRDCKGDGRDYAEERDGLRGDRGGWTCMTL